MLIQRNKSLMLLHKNYLFLVKKGSEYMHARYFFAVDKIESKEVKIV